MLNFPISVANNQQQFVEIVEETLNYLQGIEKISSKVELEAIQKLLSKLSHALPGPISPEKLRKYDIGERWNGLVTFSILLTELIKKFSEYHEDEEIVALISKFFMVAENVEFALEILQVLTDLQLLSECPNMTVKLLENALLDDQFVLISFMNLSCKKEPDDIMNMISSQLLQIFVSIPDKVSNSLKSQTPTFFHPKIYSAILLENFLKAFYLIGYINFHENQQIYNISFLSKLLSKTIVNFSVDKKSQATKNTLAILSEWSHEACHNQLVHQLLLEISRSAINVVANFLLEVENPNLVIMLKDATITSPNWRYMLLKKIPFLSFTSNDIVIENLIHYLAVTAKDQLLEGLLKELLVIWSNKTCILESSFEQHFYLTKLMLLSIKYLFTIKNPGQNYIQSIKHSVFDGVQHHIGSTDGDLRSLGMATVETILVIVDDQMNGEPQLKFDYEDFSEDTKNNIINVLMQYPNRMRMLDIPIRQENFKIVEDNMLELESIIKLRVLNEFKDLIAFIPLKSNVDQDFGNIEETKNEDQDELDSDDDLKPYDEAPTESYKDASKRPKYLLDLIQAFTVKENLEDADKFEMAVEFSEKIISQQAKNNHPDITVELLRIFLHLEKKYYMENFEECKMKSLVALSTAHSKECAQYLCQEFNTEISAYTVNKRILMLDILTDTARKLSKIDVVTTSSQPSSNLPTSCNKNKLTKKLLEESIDHNRLAAEKTIRERLLKKTRSLTTRTKPVGLDGQVNRFNEVAGWFFFPLINGFGKKQLVFTNGTTLKYDTDNLLLSNFLSALSVLMLCAENCVIAPKFAREIFNLSLFLRYHQEAKIRMGVLKVIASVFIAVPRKVLNQEFDNELQELKAHLENCVQSTVLYKEPNKDCQELAKHLLTMCLSILYN